MPSFGILTRIRQSALVSTLNWVPLRRHIGDTRVLVADSNHPNTLYLGTGPRQSGACAEIFKSTDGGAKWVRTGVLPPYFVPTAIVFDQGNTIYVSAEFGGIVKSMDGGQSWIHIESTGLPGGARAQVWDLAADPYDSSTLFAATPLGGAYKSMDCGISWNRMALPLSPSTIAVDPAKRSTLYAVFQEPGPGVFKSHDAGARWNPINNGLPQIRPYVFVSSIALNPTDTDVIYATTHDGIFKSTTAGAYWVPAGARRHKPLQAFLLTVAWQDPLTIYALGTDGVYITRDGAKSWQRARKGTSLESRRHSLVVSDPKTAFVVQSDSPIEVARPFKTSDSGKTWSDLSKGISSSKVAFK
jgi:photosystem II stability/assembly factor-like uncharacterized protein